MPSLIARILMLAMVFMASSCGTLFLKMYGMKQASSFDNDGLENLCKKYNIPIANAYSLDTSYMTFLRQQDTVLFEQQIQNHYQPLQVLYYDQSGKLLSFHINCYAGGFPNLKWSQIETQINSIPLTQAPIDSLVPFHELKKFMKKIKSQSDLEQSNVQYHIVVLWNNYMGRQSKRLLELVKRKSSENLYKNQQLYFVNTDNFVAKYYN